MDTSHKGSRTYCIKMNWLENNPDPIVIDNGLPYKTVLGVLSDLEKVWRKRIRGVKITRTRDRLVMGNLSVWFEEEENDRT